MNLMDLLEKGLNSKETIESLTGSLDIDSKKAREAARLSVPAMLKGLEENTRTEKGRESLERALDDHNKRDLNDLSDFLKSTDKSDGEKILTHIFGERRERVETNISKETGLDLSAVQEIMQKLAPLVLGFLGKKKEKGQPVTELLSGILENTEGLRGLANKLLGKDSDGTIPTEIGDILGGLFKSKN